MRCFRYGTAHFDEPDAAGRSAVLMELSEPRHRKDPDEGAVRFVRATRRPR